ncbi:pentatricopeptide repeat-containing protein At1g06143-like [Syzygium oleosum]|uniref:pentatricopeptide repeat-containing protein At1g06143-like n=1 Tax=Syzygium oleosum TaxID=219896 RepID=UPI0024B882D3|nr:pentatricopeptide repeat-containing protein At1g06143-like [Syzygium oleosum]
MIQAPKISIWKQAIVDRLKRCASGSELESIYASMIKKSADQDCFLMNQFISAASSATRHPALAVSAFDRVENPNAFVYNAMIRCLARGCSPVPALECYKSMLRDDVRATSFALSSLVKACGAAQGSGLGESVHGHAWRNGFGSHVFVQTALIDLYAGFGNIIESRKVFDEMPERDAFAWTTMVSAHARSSDMSAARALFEEMPERNVAAWNAMIDGYARLGDVELAESLFEQMTVRDIISWTTMITCYSQNGRFREALTTFREMTAHGITPDEVSIAAVISACAHLSALDAGKEIHHYAMQNRFCVDVYIGSALVDMYAKCGSLDSSLVVFYKLREKNLFCWNSVIEGLAMHGYAENALKMFEMMEREKIKPNGVTFVSVLSACTHAGLVDEGRRWFCSMTDDYNITPGVEQYGCMVDLLSKAGLLEDALKLIQNMKVEPNSVIWGALLGGCKLHRNLEIAQVAANALKVLEPENSGYSALLVNMYAEVSRWGEVAKIRASMKEQRVEKECPGASSIEMEGEIHQFAASDKDHPDASEIYLLLDELDGQLKLSGSREEIQHLVLV